MAQQLEPLFGPFAKYLLGMGLFAAGLTSAITAPLATGYAMTEILRLEGGQQGRGFRLVAISVIVVGAMLALAGIRPIEVIVIAQVANGLLLPIIAAFLLYAVNRARLLGDHANGALANTLGVAVVLLATGLGLRIIYVAFGAG
jgi:manganese transport protein